MASSKHQLSISTLTGEMVPPVLTANLLGVLVGIAGTQPHTAVTPTPRKFVALGDSYVSGEGTYVDKLGPFDDGYIPGTDSNDHRCHRAQGAWNTTFHQYADDKVAPLDISIDPTTHKSDFIACSGAVIKDLREGSKNNWSVAQVGGTKTTDPDFVTVTIGGNDAHFADVVKACYTDKITHECGKEISAAKSRLPAIQQDLVSVYGDIHGAYPRARIFVVGYPQILGTKTASHRVRCLWLNPARWDDLRGVPRILNQTVAGAVNSAQQNGVPVTYVDVEPALKDHELCTGDSYVRDISVTGGRSQYSAHPAPRGQAAISRMVGAEVKKWADQPTS